MNVSWLNSSLSIKEQNIEEYDTLWLQYKFYSFHDLNPKLDSVRINQIYEQAKWQLLGDHIDCTEEEVMMFAALQLQTNMKNGEHFESNNEDDNNDIDQALNDLQLSLEGSSLMSGFGNMSNNDITTVPELSDNLKWSKPKKFGLKNFKKYWTVYRDAHIYLYKSRENAGKDDPTYHIALKGCEATPDVNIAQRE
jgi:kindlin 2